MEKIIVLLSTKHLVNQLGPSIQRTIAVTIRVFLSAFFAVKLNFSFCVFSKEMSNAQVEIAVVAQGINVGKVCIAFRISQACLLVWKILGEGDCDDDSDCKKGLGLSRIRVFGNVSCRLVCGKDNCRALARYLGNDPSTFDSKDDCCYAKSYSMCLNKKISANLLT